MSHTLGWEPLSNARPSGVAQPHTLHAAAGTHTREAALCPPPRASQTPPAAAMGAAGGVPGFEKTMEAPTAATLATASPAAFVQTAAAESARSGPAEWCLEARQYDRIRRLKGESAAQTYLVDIYRGFSRINRRILKQYVLKQTSKIVDAEMLRYYGYENQYITIQWLEEVILQHENIVFNTGILLGKLRNNRIYTKLSRPKIGEFSTTTTGLDVRTEIQIEKTFFRDLTDTVQKLRRVSFNLIFTDPRSSLY